MEESIESFVDDFGECFEDEEVEEQVEPKHKERRTVHAGTPKEKPRIYSQLLGRYVEFNTCISCGEKGHTARTPLCPMYGRNRGKKNNFHTSGQTSPQQRATRYLIFLIFSLHLRFASWLLETFGEEYLKATGVLDIAGGQGKLSLDLQLRRGYISV
jgi:hypothetical protein